MRQMKRRTILELKYYEARAFLMRPESYCSLDLPLYFDFQPILNIAQNILKENNNSVDKCCKQINRKPDNDRVNYAFYPNVNYSIISNKDSLYAFREFQLIHPIRYVDLIDLITNRKQ